MKTRTISFTLLGLWLLGCFTGVRLQAATPLGTAITYQGRLDTSLGAADGLYDFEMSLWDAASGPTQIGTTLSFPATPVVNGVFTLTLDFGAAAFGGDARWVQVAVRTNGAPHFSTLSPRQPLNPSPHALYAPNAGLAERVPLGSIGSLSLAANSVTSGKIADGSVTSADVAPNTFWQLGGNSGSSPGTHFLGTTDNQPLELRVRGKRGWLLEPTAEDASHSGLVNVLGGSGANVIGSGVHGAVVSGGGGVLYFGVSGTNRVDEDFGTVGGGWKNTIGIDSGFSAIAGGAANTIEARNTCSTIAGGTNNVVLAPSSLFNLHGYNTIAGGSGNTIQDIYSAISGGKGNLIEDAQIYGGSSFIGGGRSNRIAGDCSLSVIGGGHSNLITGDASHQTIAGGTQNLIQDSGTGGSFVGGGHDNQISRCSGNNVLAGGEGNLIDLARHATIPGGYRNLAKGNFSFAAGNRAKANYPGDFVWADSSDADFSSTAANQFLIRAVGGVGINKNNPATALDVNGTVTATTFSGSGALLTGISGAGLADGSVTSAKILDGTIASADLGAGAVTSTKLASDSAGLAKVTAGSMSIVAGAANFWREGYLQDQNLYFRGDQNHGLGWFGAGKLYAGVDVNGPALFGNSGGVLGWRNAGVDHSVLAWNSSGNVGIGNTAPEVPLSFAYATGEKISLWGGASANYGFGVQNNLLQIHGDAQTADIAFGYGSSTSFTERARIKGAGSVSGSSDGILNVGSSTGPHLTIDHDEIQVKNTTTLFLNYYSGAVNVCNGLIRAGSSRVGIGRAASGQTFEVEGDASKTTAGLWLANSDARIKQDVQPISNALETLGKVRLVEFGYTDAYRADHPSIENRIYWNVIAQEFQEVFPDAVRSSGEKLPDGSDILQVDTYPLVIYSAAAIQELNQKLQQKEAELRSLQDRLSALEAAVAALTKR